MLLIYEGILTVPLSDSYISYLKNFDKKVPNNYDATKPFVGIVLEINGFKYLAPLTSYKPSQERIANNKPTSVKMHEQGNPDNKLGMIQLNNMIPVQEHVIAEFAFESRDIRYQNLVNNQLVYIKTVKAEIEKKAAKLYKLVCVTRVQHYVENSCHFEVLEAACNAYAPPVAENATVAPAIDAQVKVVDSTSVHPPVTAPTALPASNHAASQTAAANITAPPTSPVVRLVKKLDSQ